MAILGPVTTAMSESITAVFLLAVLLLLIGVVLAVVMPELPLKDTAHIGATLEGAEIHRRRDRRRRGGGGRADRA